MKYLFIFINIVLSILWWEIITAPSLNLSNNTILLLNVPIAIDLIYIIWKEIYRQRHKKSKEIDRDTVSYILNGEKPENKKG